MWLCALAKSHLPQTAGGGLKIFLSPPAPTANSLLSHLDFLFLFFLLFLKRFLFFSCQLFKHFFSFLCATDSTGIRLSLNNPRLLLSSHCVLFGSRCSLPVISIQNYICNHGWQRIGGSPWGYVLESRMLFVFIFGGFGVFLPLQVAMAILWEKANSKKITHPQTRPWEYPRPEDTNERLPIYRTDRIQLRWNHRLVRLDEPEVRAASRYVTPFDGGVLVIRRKIPDDDFS